MSSTKDEMSTHDLLKGHLDLYHHVFCYPNSMALGCASDLGIPSAIHRRGGTATIGDLVTETALHPAKLPYLRRIMRVLTTSGIFAAIQPSPDSIGEVVYTLTPASRLLVGDKPSCDMSAFVRFLVHPTTVTSFCGMEEWLRNDSTTAGTLFETAHGIGRWDMTNKDAAFNKSISDACVADSNLVIEVVLKEGCDVFRRISSLVDVGGGHGAAAAAITKAFPHVKCSVLDLQQVISQAPNHGEVQFIAGDMFESIPPADVVLLKYVLDCWGDDDCVTILRQCKKAIPPRGAGGKVVIINAVLSSAPQDNVVTETQVLFDMYIMHIGGAEREEHEWKKIFLEAGFSDYQIIPIIGFLSIIEVYP